MSRMLRRYDSQTMGKQITRRQRSRPDPAAPPAPPSQPWPDLRESGHLFRAVFDESFQFMVVLKPDGTLLEANRAALEFRRLKLGDVLGQPFWQTAWCDLSHQTRQRIRTAIADAARGT